MKSQGRGDRWGLVARAFPPKDFKDWDSTPYRRLDQLATDLSTRPMESVLQELDRESVLALPWPESRALLRRSLKTANKFGVLALLRIIEDVSLPGMAQELLRAGDRIPEIKTDLLSLWAKEPDRLAQDGIVQWGKSIESQRDWLLLSRALENPNKLAQEFLLSRLLTADPALMAAIAKTLGALKDPKDLSSLKRRLTELDEDERLPFVEPFVALGGDAPWSWVESYLDANLPGPEKLVRAMAKNLGLVPESWALSYAGDANPFRRRIARMALIHDDSTRRAWSEKILLDRSEDSIFRIQAGLALEQEELRGILRAVVPDIAGDPVLSGFALSLDGAGYERGGDLHARRVALLFEVYREGGDDLIRSWALAGLESLAVPEFAMMIARDLAAYEADSSGSLLRDILGKSMQNQELSLVLGELKRHGRHVPLARTPTVNAARCRFLGQTGRLKTWPKNASKEDVARTLIECAARRDLRASTREAALEALASFPEAIKLAELKEVTVYDSDGRLTAAAANLLAGLNRDREAFELLSERNRPVPTIFVAKAWLFAKAGQIDRAVALLELAAMKGYRRRGNEPAFADLPALAARADFLEVWRRLGSG